MGAIQWTDLGRKYIIKRGKRSIKADFGVSISAQPKMLKTDYETYSEDNQKIKLELGGDEDKNLNRQLSLSRISQMNMRFIRNPSKLSFNTVNAAS